MREVAGAAVLTRVCVRLVVQHDQPRNLQCRTSLEHAACHSVPSACKEDATFTAGNQCYREGSAALMPKLSARSALVLITNPLARRRDRSYDASMTAKSAARASPPFMPPPWVPPPRERISDLMLQQNGCSSVDEYMQRVRACSPDNE